LPRSAALFWISFWCFIQLLKWLRANTAIVDEINKEFGPLVERYWQGKTGLLRE
jgi:hypothetical protein